MKKITLLLALLTLSFGANAQVIFSEDFGTGTDLPAGWVTVNESALGDANEVWTVLDTGEAYYYTPAGNTYLYTDAELEGSYALFNSDSYGQNGAEQASLISPAFDCSGGGTIKLGLNHWFRTGYGAVGTISASSDGGNTWTEVASLSATVAGYAAFDITSVVGTSSTSHVKFTYTGDWDYFWAVDNVEISSVSAAPDAVTNLMPADGAVDVPIMLNEAGDTKMIGFTFDAPTRGEAADRYDWYFGTSETELSLGVDDYDGTAEGAGITWGTSLLEGWQPSTTYYWKMHSVNIVGETPTAIHSFTTAAADPLSNNKNAFEDITLYPNPTTGVMTLSGIDMNSLSDIEITNQLGQQVMSIAPSKLDANTLDIRNLNKGIYFVQVTNNTDKSKTFKVIKK